MITVKANGKTYVFPEDSKILETLRAEAAEVREDEPAAKLPGYVKDGKVYTHDVAMLTLEQFEDLLDEKDITITCASKSEEEDRQADEDNAARLYGSEYSDLQDSIEDLICEVLDAASVDYVRDEYSGNC